MKLTKREPTYNEIWKTNFWKPLIESENYAITEQDMKTLYNYGYKVYRIGGYQATTKFFAEQLEILTQGEKQCRNNTKSKSASGFLSLLARLLSFCALLRKSWK